MTPGEALRSCIEAAGSQCAFARAMGLRSQGSVSGMLRRGQIAQRHTLAAERLWGVPRYELRPDIYPVEPTYVAPHKRQE